MENLLLKLVDEPEKSISLEKGQEEQFMVENIRFENDIDLIDLDLRKGDKKYEDLVLVKGEIYPIPKNIQILRVKRLCLKYDPNYQLKLYLNGEFSDSKMIPVNDPKDIYSFRSDKILNTISKLTNIDISNKKSGLFKIIKIWNVWKIVKK